MHRVAPCRVRLVNESGLLTSVCVGHSQAAETDEEREMRLLEESMS